MISVGVDSSFDDKQRCCGCGACANACPKKCISMEADQEGFLYPKIKKETCIDCGLCERVCPVIQVDNDREFAQQGYIVQHRNDDVRKESTAGGAFTAIAQYVISLGGVAFGAAYDERFNVHHIAVESEEDLWRFRNSKYVQSRTEEALGQAKEYLQEGRMVCFSGTPCQIEGLKRCLRKEYENLITVDVVCHAVPSPLVFRKYVQMQRQQLGSSIGNIRFRDKHYGYQYSTMTVKDNFGKDLYAYGIDTDPMLRSFFANVCDRPSCYDCQFKKRYRVSDFTIWDCYPVYEFNKTMDDDKGTTRVLVHSEKGRKIFEKIKAGLKWHEVDPDDLTKGVKEMFYSVPISEKRSRFMEDATLLDGQELFRKWFPETIKVRVERMIRITLIKSGIYAPAKRFAKSLLRK